jgi:hypothetical protein
VLPVDFGPFGHHQHFRRDDLFAGLLDRLIIAIPRRLELDRAGLVGSTGKNGRL